MRGNPILYVFVATALWLQQASASVVDADAVPVRAQVVAGSDATLAVTWQVTVDAAGDPGASSPAGSFVNATTGAPIAPPVALPLGTLAGRGVLSFPELVTIDGDQIAAWFAQGIRRVGYRRTFTSPGSIPRTAQMLLAVSGSGLEGLRDGTAAQLQIIRMELTFKSGNRIEIVEKGADLDAGLTVGYGGSGTLRGRWQIAEPGGGSRPFFRTLALVRETLAPVQRAVIESPRLPTQARGRYVLRFCLEVQDQAAEECADSSSSVQTLYEVTAQESVSEIRGLQPNGLAAGEKVIFRWEQVPGAAMYQLQVFQAKKVDPAAVLAGGSEQTPEQDLSFVTGLLIPADAAQTTLSDLVRSRLQGGQRYLWRISAHDAGGGLLARSQLVPFVYESRR